VGWAVTPPRMPSSNLVHLVQRVPLGAEFVHSRRVTPASYATTGVRYRCFETMCWSKRPQLRLDSTNQLRLDSTNMRPVQSGALADSRPGGKAMSQRVRHALNPASERLLEGVGQARLPLLRIEHRRQPGNVGADHVVVDDSVRGANPAVVIIGIRRGRFPTPLWRSMAIVEWSRKAGVKHLPALSGNESVAHINPSPREAAVNPELAGIP
jgi:hypothetical protein